MKNQIVNVPSTPESSRRARRVLVLSGLWLRIGFIGASGVAAGVLQLLASDVKPLSALALAVGGGVLAAGSWWRARTVLDAADDAAAPSGAAPACVNAGVAAGM